MSQGSGRYQRSAAGMVGAMIVTLLVIIVFVAFRAVNRDELIVRPEAVDYLQTVEALQQGDDLDPVYPPTLPEGWIARRAVFSAEHLAWELDILTDDEKYIGLRQAVMPEQDLIEEYVDEEGEPEGSTGLGGTMNLEWEGWKVDGDDTAFTTKIDGATVLVFGSAPAAEVKAFAASLVVD
ncbi:DUF4245 domain-containing protein [Nocardioides cavernaquae]|nr:DUF4245 domain-containing protein [Nocardioides cavernaquae]